MRAGPVGWGACRVVVLLLLVGTRALGEDRPSWPEPEPASQVRVSSGESDSSITIRVRPDTEIEDRTAGAKPATSPRGPAAVGQTFAGDITLFLRGAPAPRSASVDVADAVVSTVRLFPEAGGTTVVIFVRQPVTYAVSRPSALGDVAIEVKSRVQPLRQAGATRRGAPRYARPKETGSGEVAVDAEELNYDQQTSVLTARGNVTVTRGNLVLTADEVRYDKGAATVDARGHVVLTDPEATVDGDAAHLNLDDEVGWVDDANGEMRTSGYALQCGQLVKKGGPLYTVRDGVFTTCQCGGLERPTWSIAAKETEVELDGRGVAKHATFRLKDLPVLYFPYFVFPANTTRQSGFLVPSFGTSSQRGFYLTVPYYWAINKSSDLSVALHVETKARLGVLADYRYVRTRQSHGEFSVAYFNEQIRGLATGTTIGAGVAPDIAEDRFGIYGHHVERLGGNGKLFLDMLAVSDEAFLKDIRPFPLFGPHDRYLRFTTNRAGYVKTWADGMVRADATYWQDLEAQQGLTLERLPRLDVTHGLTLVDQWLYARIDGQAENYQRQGGFDGLRGDVAPELSMPFHLGPYLSGSVSARGHETGYHLTDREQVALLVADDGSTRQLREVSALRPYFADPAALGALDRTHGRAAGEFRGRLASELTRVYTFEHWGLEKLRHTIEPEVRYLFVPDLGTQRAEARLRPCRVDTNGSLLPGYSPGYNCGARLFATGYLFDELDAIDQRNFVSYGFTTRLLGRGATTEEAAASAEEADSTPATIPAVDGTPKKAIVVPAPRELARLSVLHGYDFDRVIAERSHASDVDVVLRLLPLDWVGFAYDTSVNLERGDVLGQRVGLSVRDPWWTQPTGRTFQTPTTAAVTYQFVADGNHRGLTPGSVEQFLVQGRGTGLEELGGVAYMALGQYLGLFFRGVYDLTDAGGRGPHFKERSYFLRVLSRCNCWILDVGFTDQFNPDDRAFRFQLTMVGLGSYGRGRGRSVLPTAAPGMFPAFRTGGMY
ncbi:MAG: LPS assembly protein LptD [Candidatus Binatia bacterium]